MFKCEVTDQSFFDKNIVSFWIFLSTKAEHSYFSAYFKVENMLVYVLRFIKFVIQFVTASGTNMFKCEVINPSTLLMCYFYHKNIVSSGFRPRLNILTF